MKGNLRGPLITSLVILFLIPLFFLIISMITSDWRYVLFSVPPALFAGLTGLMVTVNERKNLKDND
ncbi:hypothetical protein [Ornithinibacillus halophilus]|uniref:Uncharacterized protein n=1 Tax=Ornithinibacillus halophilus TaxID=930117 RepID=A0A1M5LPW4_9BACI|nr:hypothetical protein [Ornithinibacillus halophilus]SHG67144.1 hypothetical protein SAMN05216225_104917 [Ornithinibacillus halophilus]